MKAIRQHNHGACVLAALIILVLSATLQAQFTFITNNGAITITGYTGPGGDVVIPSMTNGFPVTSIGDGAFWECSNLTNVTIPDGVTRIGSYVFGFCTNLISVTMTNSVASIGVYVFEFCVSLTNITIPNGVPGIATGAFYLCTNLMSVTIPNSVTSVGSYSFYDCASLTSVTIPNNLIFMGDYAFSCPNLTAAYFEGNAPPGTDDGTAFLGSSATVYYLPGTIGWGTTFGSRPTALWTPPDPVILSRVNGNTTLGIRKNQFGFSIWGATNLSVIVLTATNLVNPFWMPVSTNTLIGGIFYFSDPDWTNYPSRFYRIRSP